MGIGDAKEIQHTLDIAVLDPAAMQGIEQDIGLLRIDRSDHRLEVTGDVNRGDLIAGLGQSRGAIGTAGQRDFPLCRWTAHQDRYPLHA